jgi:hypothetical protein
MIVLRTTSTSLSNCFVGAGNSASTAELIEIVSQKASTGTAGLSFLMRGNTGGGTQGAESSVTSYQDGKPHVIIGTSLNGAAANVHLYLDGIEIGSVFNSGQSVGVGTFNTRNICAVRRTTEFNYAAANVALFAEWQGVVLTRAQAVALSRDPFQLIRRPALALFLPALAATGKPPIWHLSQMAA